LSEKDDDAEKLPSSGGYLDGSKWMKMKKKKHILGGSGEPDASEDKDDKPEDEK
jgi:hypothetical protein